MFAFEIDVNINYLDVLWTFAVVITVYIRRYDISVSWERRARLGSYSRVFFPLL